MPTNLPTPAAYLAELPPDRREAISAVVDVVRANLDPRYGEGIQYGMIGWFVPHAIEPRGYHCDPKQPIPFAAVASQKSHIGIYLFCVYCDPALKDWFVDEWTKTGKKLDMGASCIRVKDLAGIPLDLIGETIRRMPCDEFLRQYESLVPEKARAKWNKGAGEATPKAATKPTAKKAAPKKPATKKAAAKKAAPTKPAAKKAGGKR